MLTVLNEEFLFDEKNDSLKSFRSARRVFVKNADKTILWIIWCNASVSCTWLAKTEIYVLYARCNHKETLTRGQK